MRVLKLDEFSGREGQIYRIEGDEETLELKLIKVKAMPYADRDGGSFLLHWMGPKEPQLPQATYTIRHGDESYDIFIVPIAAGTDGTCYEAVFN